MEISVKKILCKILAAAAVLYGLLFAIFYFDIDGKLIYYIWEPFACRHYDRMKRKDNTQTPYSPK